LPEENGGKNNSWNTYCHFTQNLASFHFVSKYGMEKHIEIQMSLLFYVGVKMSPSK